MNKHSLLTSARDSEVFASGGQNPTGTRLSFLEQLREAAEAARNAEPEHPWEPALRKLKGRVRELDGVEVISTSDVFDELEVPVHRRPSLTVELSRLMRKNGWVSIRAHGLAPNSYRSRIRGYARPVPDHPATKPNGF